MAHGIPIPGDVSLELRRRSEVFGPGLAAEGRVRVEEVAAVTPERRGVLVTALGAPVLEHEQHVCRRVFPDVAQVLEHLWEAGGGVVVAWQGEDDELVRPA